MATLDKAEQLEERLVMAAGQQGVSATLRLTTETGKRLTRWSGTAVKKTGVGMARTVAYGHQALSESLREMADGIRERAHEKEWGSEVPLEEFAETVEGKREVVALEDDELVEEVRQELRKHRVTFAVEQDDQERFYLHVRGNDANLIAHALDRAQERLDALRTRDEPTQDRDDIDRDEPEQEQTQGTPGAEERQHATPHQDETLSPEEAELSAREEAELERRTNARIDQPDELELNGGERAALAKALNDHGDHIISGTDDLDTRERAAELQTDPIYAYNSDLFDKEIEREEAHIASIQQGAVEQARPFQDLASEVERSGRVDLADPQQRSVVSEALTEHIDAARDGETVDPALEQITGRLAGTTQTQAPERNAPLEHNAPMPPSPEEAKLAQHSERVQEPNAFVMSNAAQGKRLATPEERANDPALATLPDGYESIADENARQRGPEPAPTGREPRDQQRPARGREDNPRRPERAEGRGRGDAPRRTGLDSREQSKATIRDKISAVADRLQSAAGRDAPTHVRGLDAHKKGPTR